MNEMRMEYIPIVGFFYWINQFRKAQKLEYNRLDEMMKCHDKLTIAYIVTAIFWVVGFVSIAGLMILYG